MRSADIAALMVAGINREASSKDLEFHQGVVEAWNPVTGENTVRINGTALTNLRLLSSGAETAFAVGETVGVLMYRTVPFVLGRISAPGNQATTATGAASEGATNFAVPKNVGGLAPLLIDVVLHIPAWASRAMITATFNGQAFNSTSALDTMTKEVLIPGAPDAVSNAFAPAQRWLDLSMAATGAVAVTPGGSITINAYLGASGNRWSANSLNHAHLSVSAFFTTG